ncbi:recombinase family protein [Stutzerimonas frequens]|uniref:recombinase family protein n=1 Tax=Stutzerimonas frequens TaxID=2968969 RepID=UPI00190BD8F6|nr:recombinase family protein [Stutzerimonas frequens]MBK3874000.1 serine recombinase [Stutzerimonas frequens]MBK3912269.1 serine recombinase [Stutzerimonas frequens]MBK3931552.1 serine recombinase [Stutzerimonas frequens]
MRVVAYYRVSTASQGQSGLGLDAQREYVRIAASQGGWTVIAEFEDRESGALPPESRTACKAALARCRAEGATLVVAKLDRLSRDVEHIAGLLKLVDFKVATMPNADKFQLHLYAALAEQEREFISRRTVDALASLKARAEAGDRVAQQKIERRTAGRSVAHSLGNGAAVRAAQAKADQYAEGLRSAVKAALFDGVQSLPQLAAWLERHGHKTARGASFTPTAASRLLLRLNMTFR